MNYFSLIVPTAQERWKKAVWKVSVAHGFSIPVIGDDISGSGTLDEDVMEELQKKDMVNCILFIFGELSCTDMFKSRRVDVQNRLGDLKIRFSRNNTNQVWDDGPAIRSEISTNRDTEVIKDARPATLGRWKKVTQQEILMKSGRGASFSGVADQVVKRNRYFKEIKRLVSHEDGGQILSLQQESTSWGKAKVLSRRDARIQREVRRYVAREEHRRNTFTGRVRYRIEKAARPFLMMIGRVRDNRDEEVIKESERIKALVVEARRINFERKGDLDDQEIKRLVSHEDGGQILSLQQESTSWGKAKVLSRRDARIQREVRRYVAREEHRRNTFTGRVRYRIEKAARPFLMMIGRVRDNRDEEVIKESERIKALVVEARRINFERKGDLDDQTSGQSFQSISVAIAPIFGFFGKVATDVWYSLILLLAVVSYICVGALVLFVILCPSQINFIGYMRSLCTLLYVLYSREKYKMLMIEKRERRLVLEYFTMDPVEGVWNGSVWTEDDWATLKSMSSSRCFKADAKSARNHIWNFWSSFDFCSTILTTIEQKLIEISSPERYPNTFRLHLKGDRNEGVRTRWVTFPAN
eukprot:sb/3463320/